MPEAILKLWEPTMCPDIAKWPQGRNRPQLRPIVLAIQNSTYLPVVICIFLKNPHSSEAWSIVWYGAVRPPLLQHLPPPSSDLVKRTTGDKPIPYPGLPLLPLTSWSFRKIFQKKKKKTLTFIPYLYLCCPQIIYRNITSTYRNKILEWEF